MHFTAKSYVKHSLAALACVVAALAGFMVAVDAHGVFGTQTFLRRHLPPKERLISRGDRVIKALEIAQRSSLETLIVGDSRSAMGIDPASPHLGAGGAYNGALMAADIRQQIGVIDFAIAKHPRLRRVVWGLNFDAFGASGLYHDDYSDSGFGGRNSAYGYARLLFDRLIIRNSFGAALGVKQNLRTRATTSGLLLTPYTLEQLADRERFFARELADAISALNHLPRERQDSDRAQAMRLVNETVNAMLAKGISVDLALAPAHAWRLLGYRELGMQDAFASWKAGVTSLARAAIAEHPHARLRVLDFATVTPWSTEAVMPPAPTPADAIFFETSHFKASLGERILARLAHDRPFPESPTFGVDLLAADLDQHLAGERTALDAWMNERPAEAALVAAIAGRHPPAGRPAP